MPDAPATLGFLVNPIAGMGGRVGLKGTDHVLDRALALGAVPLAPRRALETVSSLRRALLAAGAHGTAPAWLTCSGAMGADCLREAGFEHIRVVHECAEPTSAGDTRAACEAFLREAVALVLFCGGDGTARDVCAVIGTRIPILGIPAGVKMYSGVFGVSARRTAVIVHEFLRGRLEVGTADVMDLDEERYREDEWRVRLCDQALTPREPTFTQAAKAVVAGDAEEAAKQEIADHLAEQMRDDRDTLWLLGAGSTLQAIGRELGIDKSLLGIDAVAAGALVASDVNEDRLLDLLASYPRCRLVLSPIGAQGFVVGRGNSQLSPAVLRAIGPGNVVVVATPAKLAGISWLRFDTGDEALDAELAGRGYLRVTIGYRRHRLVKVEI